MRQASGWAIGAVFLLGGCATLEEPEGDALRSAASPSAGHAEGDVAAATPKRGRMLGGERVRRVVQWPRDAELDAATVAKMPGESQTAIDVLPLPGLVSSRPEYASSTTLMQGKHWYASWSQHEGLTVTLNASGEARVYPHVKPHQGPDRIRGTYGFVAQNEAVWSVTWIEHGVAYDLSLECETPTMPECQDGAFASGLAEDLVFVGPREGVR